MSAKLIYVLSSFNMLFCAILYPSSCKTHKIFSKLGFVGLLMKKQVIWQEISNIFSKEELIESLTARHWKDEFFCTI